MGYPYFTMEMQNELSKAPVWKKKRFFTLIEMLDAHEDSGKIFYGNRFLHILRVLQITLRIRYQTEKWYYYEGADGGEANENEDVLLNDMIDENVLLNDMIDGAKELTQEEAIKLLQEGSIKKIGKWAHVNEYTVISSQDWPNCCWLAEKLHESLSVHRITKKIGCDYPPIANRIGELNASVKIMEAEELMKFFDFMSEQPLIIQEYIPQNRITADFIQKYHKRIIAIEKIFQLHVDESIPQRQKKSLLRMSIITAFKILSGELKFYKRHKAITEYSLSLLSKENAQQGDFTTADELTIDEGEQAIASCSNKGYWADNYILPAVSFANKREVLDYYFLEYLRLSLPKLVETIFPGPRLNPADYGEDFTPPKVFCRDPMRPMQ